MVLQNTELVGTPVTSAAMKRFYPTELRSGKFAAIGGAPVIAKGTPLAFDTTADTWKVWATGGANGVGTIRGFAWPDDIQSHATGEVLGVIMKQGIVHFDDIIVTGGTLAQLKTAIQDGSPSLRELGISVEGLAQVY
jgi:hypothetical protein